MWKLILAALASVAGAVTVIGNLLGRRLWTKSAALVEIERELDELLEQIDGLRAAQKDLLAKLAAHCLGRPRLNDVEYRRVRERFDRITGQLRPLRRRVRALNRQREVHRRQ